MKKGIIQLYFTEEEMEMFLVKKGYVVSNITSWEYMDRYRNDHAWETVFIKIAYKERPPEKELDRDDYHTLYRKYGLQTIFEKEFKETLLKLLILN